MALLPTSRSNFKVFMADKTSSHSHYLLIGNRFDLAFHYFALKESWNANVNDRNGRCIGREG